MVINMKTAKALGLTIRRTCLSPPEPNAPRRRRLKCKG